MSLLEGKAFSCWVINFLSTPSILPHSAMAVSVVSSTTFDFRRGFAAPAPLFFPALPAPAFFGGAAVVVFGAAAAVTTVAAAPGGCGGWSTLVGGVAATGSEGTADGVGW